MGDNNELLTDVIGQVVDARVATKLKELGIDPDKAQAKPQNPSRALDSHVERVYTWWKQNGEEPETGKKISFDDMMTKLSDGIKKRNAMTAADAAASPDIQLILPKVIQRIVLEPIPFEETLAPLLRQIRQKGMEQHIVYPAIGAMGGLDLDMSEGEEYPEGHLDFAGRAIAQVGKSGIAIRITEEMKRYNQFDFMAMLLRAAGRALTRWKEKKIADHILGLGSTYFDNDSASFPCTTGRGIDGVANGSFTLDDLFVMYADMVNAGFIPNTLLMHPMAWLIFTRDEKMRHLAAMGAGGAWFKPVQGEIGRAYGFEPWGNRGAGNLGASAGLGGESAIARTYTDVPNLFPVPLRLVISPSVPFTDAGGGVYKTDIIMCDQNELGVLFTDEDPVTESWNDPARDIEKVKIRERYAIGILNAGQAIRIAKNVRITRNYDIEDKITWEVGSGGLPTIPTIIT